MCVFDVHFMFADLEGPTGDRANLSKMRVFAQSAATTPGMAVLASIAQWSAGPGGSDMVMKNVETESESLQ